MRGDLSSWDFYTLEAGQRQARQRWFLESSVGPLGTVHLAREVPVPCTCINSHALDECRYRNAQFHLEYCTSHMRWLFHWLTPWCTVKMSVIVVNVLGETPWSGGHLTGSLMCLQPNDNIKLVWNYWRVLILFGTWRKESGAMSCISYSVLSWRVSPQEA